MSIDSLTISPNPVNASQNYVISVVATPEEIPTPETSYKLGGAVYYCSFTTITGSKNNLLDDQTNTSEVQNSSTSSGNAAIISQFAFPELSGHQIVGVQAIVCFRNYSTFATATQGSLYMQFVNGIENESAAYTALISNYDFSYSKRTDYAEYETPVMTDSALLDWLNANMSDGVLTGNGFGIRVRGVYVRVCYAKLKFYYI